ncbi:MAG: PEP-CTERM sorting domain-containing protein, partial [Methylovulum sp.]|nr:PEP-CTERM sorting domain-containing protein [Methylovulum sp.]
TQIAGTAAGAYDVVAVHGHVSFGAGSLEAFNLSAFSQAAGQSFIVLLSDYAFLNLSNLHYLITGLDAGLAYTIADIALGGGAHELQLNLSDASGAVPEPGSLALLAVAGGLLARFRRRLLAA